MFMSQMIPKIVQIIYTSSYKLKLLQWFWRKRVLKVVNLCLSFHITLEKGMVIIHLKETGPIHALGQIGLK